MNAPDIIREVYRLFNSEFPSCIHSMKSYYDIRTLQNIFYCTKCTAQVKIDSMITRQPISEYTVTANESEPSILDKYDLDADTKEYIENMNGHPPVSKMDLEHYRQANIAKRKADSISDCPEMLIGHLMSKAHYKGHNWKCSKCKLEVELDEPDRTSSS